MVQNWTINNPVLLFCFFAAQPSLLPPTPPSFPPHSFRQGAAVSYIHLTRSHSHGCCQARVSRPWWLPRFYHVQQIPPFSTGLVSRSPVSCFHPLLLFDAGAQYVLRTRLNDTIYCKSITSHLPPSNCFVSPCMPTLISTIPYWLEIKFQSRSDHIIVAVPFEIVSSRCKYSESRC